MARKNPANRKKRTREHIVADLSVNHVERQVLLAGHAVQRIVRDYGIDLFVATYDSSGALENGDIRIQIKATDSPEDVSGGQFIAVRIDRGDYCHWLMEPMPVILAIYDAPRDLAYWLYVQAEFEAKKVTGNLDKPGATMTLRVPRANLLTPSAVRQFAIYRDSMFAQMKGLQHHG